MIHQSKTLLKRFSPNFLFNFDAHDHNLPYIELLEAFCQAGLQMAFSIAPISFAPCVPFAFTRFL